MWIFVATLLTLGASPLAHAQESVSPPHDDEPPLAPPTPELVPADSSAGATAAETELETETETARPWYAGFRVGAFADSYYSLNLGLGSNVLPKSQADANILRAYDPNAGFSLAWAGIDIEWEARHARATIDLRVGPAADFGWGGDGQPPGVQHVKQAYGTWKAHEQIEIDLGRFDTIYGVEVAESWNNPNYSRGLVYTHVQPFWHMGLRVPACVTDRVGLTGMIVNGWGNIIDNNRGKSYGLQLRYSPGEAFAGQCPGRVPDVKPGSKVTLSVGYLGGPEGDEAYPAPADPDEQIDLDGINKRFRHLLDAVVTVEAGDFTFALNGDYVRGYVFGYEHSGLEEGSVIEPAHWYGAMLSLGYAHKWFGVGARAELIHDPHDKLNGSADDDSPRRDVLLGSGTLTLDFRPRKYLVFRLEGRYDGSNEDLFQDGSQPDQLTLTASMVVASF